jgi:hypothetical protein
MKNAIALATLTALAGAGAVLGAAGSAGADTAGKTGYIKQYAISYTSPADYSIPVHKGLPPNTPVDTLCVREGQEIDSSKTWFMIKKDGDIGYVHRNVISAPVDTPAC